MFNFFSRDNMERIWRQTKKGEASTLGNPNGRQDGTSGLHTSFCIIGNEDIDEYDDVLDKPGKGSGKLYWLDKSDGVLKERKGIGTIDIYNLSSSKVTANARTIVHRMDGCWTVDFEDCA